MTNAPNAPNSEKGRLVGIAEWLSDYWLTLTMIVVPALQAIAAVFMSDEASRLLGLEGEKASVLHGCAFAGFAIFVLAHIYCSVLQYRSQGETTQLRNELNAAKQTRELVISNAQALCDGFLQDLARGPLAFGSREENSERITLYVHDSETHFQPVGRFSFNQNYIKRGRSRYPDNQGCIGQAWQHGWYFTRLYEATDDEEAWVNDCHSLGIPKGIARSFRMKSSLYCACTVQTNGSPQPEAVVVIESTDSLRYTEDDLKRILTEDRLNYIARLIEMLRPWIGDIGLARERGY
ncbi:hypothetical protein [Maioricimonas sp. JC845]|uniref:hypothetical protein n=1 Tax=Maioricimonas sp. JC845 TaxID=3232138 RepID=UPI003459AACD